MKIYLAGPCSAEHRTLLTNIAKGLRSQQIEVYAPFELQIPNAWDMSQEEWAEKVFNADIEAIDNADAMVVISIGRESTAGTNWEQGYAYANAKRVYVYQITEQPTSLMTYWGCTGFRNIDLHKEDIVKDIYCDINKYGTLQNKCMTVLT